MASGHMTVEEREAFLADVHVGVLAIAEPDRGPFALPIWYVYEDGEVFANLDDETLKARLLRAAGRATLTVQTEAAPYQYVSVEGPVEITSRSVADIEMATRYLGPEFGRWYVDNNPATATSMTMHLRPEHWRTYDFGKLLA